jgi:predicted RNA-binding Zn ribbon-like protein
MENRGRKASNLELIGGRPCLDFANTVSTRIKGLRREYLTSYQELVVWSRHAGILSDDEAGALGQYAARHPDLGAAVLERAIALRETLYRVFSAIAERREPGGADLAAVNAALREALSHLAVVPAGSEFNWGWVVDEDGLDRMLWPIARSAADLLTSRDLGKVRECAREGCDWLFVDSSKNHSRRWCSMDMCGSRVKMRRYYRRRKKEKEGLIGT